MKCRAFDERHHNSNIKKSHAFGFSFATTEDLRTGLQKVLIATHHHEVSAVIDDIQQ